LVAESTASLARPGREPFVTLALSGGGARAIAFHLGCMRALNDCGILSNVRVMSTVSGGSVIGALYAYGRHASFNEFDQAVVALLRSGLQWQILRTALFSAQLPRIVGTILVNGSTSLIGMTIRVVLGLIRKLTGLSVQSMLQRFESLEERVPVWGSLTTAFAQYLDRQLLGGARLRDVKVSGLEVVINTCDLRTGTAFRFSSDKCGGWRYGQIESGRDLSVADAVAASSAFPALLPPLHRKFTFRQRGSLEEHVVALTDGGVYDNLGVAVLEPGRNGEFSVNRYDATHIISLNAGAGQFPIGGVTFWLTSRLMRSFNAIYRKAQDATYQRLHSYVESGSLDGFAMIYLGQNDQGLPYVPPDLIRRETVRDYPTDYARMSAHDITLLAGRGEQLTRVLVSRYLTGL
jgi:NTE family protein